MIETKRKFSLKLKVFVLIVALLCAFSGGYFVAQAVTSTSVPVYLQDFPSTASYVIKTSGSGASQVYWAVKSGGSIPYSGTNASQIINSALSSTASANGGEVIIKSGNINLDDSYIIIDESNMDVGETYAGAVGITLSMESGAILTYTGSNQAILIKNDNNYNQYVNLKGIRISLSNPSDYAIKVQKNVFDQGIIRSHWENVFIFSASYFNVAGIYIPYTSMSIELENVNVWSNQAAVNYNGLFIEADHSKITGGHYLGGTGGDIYHSAAIWVNDSTSLSLDSVVPQNPYNIYISNSYFITIQNLHSEITGASSYAIAWDGDRAGYHSFIGNYILCNSGAQAYKPEGSYSYWGPVWIEGDYDVSGTRSSPWTISSTQGITHFANGAPMVNNKLVFTTGVETFVVGTVYTFYAYSKTTSTAGRTMCMITPMVFTNQNSLNGTWAVQDNSGSVNGEIMLKFRALTSFSGTLEGFLEIIPQRAD